MSSCGHSWRTPHGCVEEGKASASKAETAQRPWGAGAPNSPQAWEHPAYASVQVSCSSFYSRLSRGGGGRYSRCLFFPHLRSEGLGDPAPCAGALSLSKRRQTQETVAWASWPLVVPRHILTLGTRDRAGLTGKAFAGIIGEGPWSGLTPKTSVSS